MRKIYTVLEKQKANLLFNSKYEVKILLLIRSCHKRMSKKGIQDSIQIKQ